MFLPSLLLNSYSSPFFKGLEKIPLKSKRVLNLRLEANFEASLEERYSMLHKERYSK